MSTEHTSHLNQDVIRHRHLRSISARSTNQSGYADVDVCYRDCSNSRCRSNGFWQPIMPITDALAFEPSSQGPPNDIAVPTNSGRALCSRSARAGPYFPSHGGGCRSHAGRVRPAFSAVAVAASISTAHTGECSPDSTWTECQLMRRRPTRRLSDVVMWRPSPASSSRPAKSQRPRADT
jgi:hypothetical protein